MLVLDADRQALPGETAGRLSFIWRKAVPLYTAASELSSFPDGSANCGSVFFHVVREDGPRVQAPNAAC